MKKIIALIFVGLVIFSFCSCVESKGNIDYKKGDLFFDVGANSQNDIDSVLIIHDGEPSEIVLSKEDVKNFEKYKFQEDYQLPELHELLIFPQNKRLIISVKDNAFSLYLLENGVIVVAFPDGEFRAYQAEGKYSIDSKKYDLLVEKYINS